MTKIIVMMVDAVGLKIFVIVHCLEYIKLAIIAIIGSRYVVACVRKYLVDTSIACGLIFLFYFIRIGLIPGMFISNPIQINNQCELVSSIMVPEMIVSRAIVKSIGLLVWEGYKLTFSGYELDSLFS